MRFRPLAMVLSALLVTPVLAETPKPRSSEQTKWTVDDTLSGRQAGDFHISPDCRWAVWTRSVADKDKGEAVTQVMRSSLTSKEEVELTRGPDSCTSPRWSPDGKLIGFLSARPAPKAKGNTAEEEAKPEEGEEKIKPQLWLLNAFGGEPWPLTSLPRAIEHFDWLDADTILFATAEAPSLYEKTTKEEKKDTSVVVEDERHAPPVRLFKVAVKTKKITRVTDNADKIESFALAPGGRYVVTTHERSLRYQYDQRQKPAVFLHDLTNNTRKQIFDKPFFNITQIRWTRDGKGFYAASAYTSHPHYVMASVTELYYYELGTGSMFKVDLDWDNGLGDTLQGEPAFTVTEDGVIALLANGARNRLARYRRSGTSWQREWLGGAHTQRLFGLELGNDQRTLVYACSSADTPTRWYRARLEGTYITAPVAITDLDHDLGGKPHAQTELVHWKGALDEEVEGVLFYPPHYQPGKKYPLIVMIHGGPFGADLDAWSESWHNPLNLLASHGAFIFKPNYHGSAGYGLKWAESIAAGKYYDLPVEDIEKGVDALIARGLVDPNRLGVMGWSNGAILTVALIVKNPRYQAASSGAGGAEWVSDWGTCEFGACFDGFYFGKSPLEDPLLYIKMAPLYQFDRIRTPTIFFQGTEDRAVPPHHGWLQYRALQQLGKTETRLVLFPGEPHSLKKLAHQRRKVEEELVWFEKHLFKSSKPDDEVVKADSPLAVALKRQAARREGSRYGVLVHGVLAPETVRHEGLEIGRFEVTRAQFAQFDRSYVVEPGKENYPAGGIAFEQAKAYCAWLSQTTGQRYHLPAEKDVAALYEKSDGPENTLDYWAGYPVNPDDAARLRHKLQELGSQAPLVKEVGSFKGNGEAPIFDLGGNVAEWVIGKDGKGRALGGSADTPADAQARLRQPAREYIGFRVIKD
jgi:dipeptidyl aminopeptidase/acylaminoacyl peptidase